MSRSATSYLVGGLIATGVTMAVSAGSTLFVLSVKAPIIEGNVDSAVADIEALKEHLTLQGAQIQTNTKALKEREVFMDMVVANMAGTSETLNAISEMNQQILAKQTETLNQQTETRTIIEYTRRDIDRLQADFRELSRRSDHE